MVKDETDEIDIEYERIIINPMDYDEKVRRKLWSVLKELGIKYEYEYY